MANRLNSGSTGRGASYGKLDDPTADAPYDPSVSYEPETDGVRTIREPVAMKIKEANKMEYTFKEHVALLIREHGVDENKAKIMAWLEGPRKK